jgi:hypothetical protein
MNPHLLRTLLLVPLALALPEALFARQGRGSIPQGPSGTVTLTVDDYDRLVDRAAQPVARPDPPPVAAVVGRAEVRARVDNGGVRGTVRLDGEVFQRGPVKVPLVAGATLLDAKADGRAVALLHEGNMHSALFTGPATFSIMLEWIGPLGAAPGRASLALPQPASPSVTVVVDLPGDPADVRVEPGLLTRRQTAAGRTTLEIAPARGAAAQLSWSVRENAAAPAESRTIADVKSLVSIGEGHLRMISLVDVTVVRGEPLSFQIQIPSGYEVANVTGSSLDRSDSNANLLTLTVRQPLPRHQFLLSLEQPHSPGSFNVDTSFPTVVGAQREAGETAIEGTGTMDLNATGDDGLRRMDVREAHAALRSLARQPLLAAFRYQRRQGEQRVMTLDVTRFADAPVIAATAEHATATTLVTAEGRMLTEVSLRINNRAQPFMKVTLPPGATMLSAEVAGEPARPLEGGGLRIPLLRTGFRPIGPYAVSFVYLHGGDAFEKRGEADLELARVDVPISLLVWEMFLPEQYSAKPVAGNVIPARFVESAGNELPPNARRDGPPRPSTTTMSFVDGVGAGQVAGRATDALGDPLPGATVTLALGGRRLQQVTTDPKGMYTLRGVPTGSVTVTSELAGFMTAHLTFAFDQQPRRLDFQMELAALSETITVQASSDTLAANQTAGQQQMPSQNVLNMQRRVAGVLPVRIDVPRAGTMYQFYRPLVLDDATQVSFRYKRR